MHRFRHGLVAAAALTLAIVSASASAKMVTIPFPSSLAMSDQCVAIEGLGWQARKTVDTCRLLVPITLPTGSTVLQIAVLHGTTDYAVGSELDALLTVHPVVSPWQPALDHFAQHDDVVHTAFDVLALRLMQQTGKNFPDAFTVQNDAAYYVDVSVSENAFVTAVQVIYD